MSRKIVTYCFHLGENIIFTRANESCYNYTVTSINSKKLKSV